MELVRWVGSDENITAASELEWSRKDRFRRI